MILIYLVFMIIIIMAIIMTNDIRYLYVLFTMLYKEIATHSSVLAWKTPWTEEPGGLQSMGLQRAGHD